jgi:hypothetical protein
MNGDNSESVWDYVRAMAYGPSQGEYYHDAMYGPLGKLQPGDVAISPNLLSKYPLGSHAVIYPEKGEPFVGRVADYSYVSPGKPTRNAIEIWNGQDLGKVAIAPVGIGMQQQQPAAVAQQPPQPPPPEPQLQQPPAGAMGTWRDYIQALGGAPPPVAAPSTTVSTAAQRAGMSVASALGSLGSSIAQQGSSGMQQAMAMLQRRSPLANYLQSFLANPMILGG